MYTFKHQYNLEAGREKVWLALLDENTFEDWNGDNAQIDDNPGAKLTMSFNGVRVVATNQKVDRSRFYLQQSWQFLDKEWNFTGSVDIRLYEHANDRSMMEVEMKEIPDERKDEVEELWRVEIVEKMNRYFDQNS